MTNHEIRPATAADWDQIWPFWRDIVEAGETYAYPTGATSEEASGWWLEQPPGATVVQWHRDQGFRGIQFNAVVETNTAAMKLWQDLGFEIIGTVPGAFASTAHGFVGLHVMFLDLGFDSAR